MAFRAVPARRAMTKFSLALLATLGDQVIRMRLRNFLNRGELERRRADIPAVTVIGSGISPMD